MEEYSRRYGQIPETSNPGSAKVRKVESLPLSSSLSVFLVLDFLSFCSYSRFTLVVRCFLFSFFLYLFFNFLFVAGESRCFEICGGQVRQFFDSGEYEVARAKHLNAQNIAERPHAFERISPATSPSGSPTSSPQSSPRGETSHLHEQPAPVTPVSSSIAK